MKPGRRGFLGGAIGLAVAAGRVRPALAAGEAQDGTGARLAEAYIAPAMREFQRAAGAMRETLDRMCRMSGPWRAEGLEEGFRALVSAWSRIAFLRFGPLLRENRHERICFWPDPRGVMLRQIRPFVQGAQAVDDLKAHSVAVQGLPALEYVLYTGKGPLAAGGAARDQALCRYAAAIAGNVADIAGALWQAWRPQGDYARDFARPGPANAFYRNDNEVLTETLKALSAGLRFEADVKLRTALTTHQSASLVVHGEVKRGNTNAAPKAPLHRGGEAPAPGPEFFTTQQAKARPRILPFWRSGLALFALAEAALGLAAFHEAAGFAREPGWLARGLDQELRQSAGLLRAREGQELRMGEDADLYRELTLVALKLDNARRMVDENLAPELGVGLGFNALDGD